MTTELLRSILQLALLRLSQVPPAELAQAVDGLQPAHIHWCLRHLSRIVWEDAEYARAKQGIMDAATHLKQNCL